MWLFKRKEKTTEIPPAGIKYNSHVQVKSGFYEGLCGIAISRHVHYVGHHFAVYYDVLLDLDKVMIEVFEKNLKVL